MGNKNPVLTALNTQIEYYDEPLVQGLSQSRFGVGFFGHSFYKNQAKVLKKLRINDIGISGNTIQDGVYPFPRKQLLYTDAKVMQNQPQVSQFINYYLTHMNQLLETVNYFTLSQQEFETAKITWLNTMGIPTNLPENPETNIVEYPEFYQQSQEIISP